MSCSPVVMATAALAMLASNALAQGDGTVRLVSFLTVGDRGLEGGSTAHKVGLINEDGTDERYPDFGRPDQASWQLGPQFADGRRIIAISYEDATTTRIRAGQVRTHSWIYDLAGGDLREILQRDRPADQMGVDALLPGEERAIVWAIINGEQRVFAMDLDGGNQVELTHAGEGFHYVLSLNSDRTRLAFHVTGGRPAFYNPGDYSINVLDLETQERVLVAGQSDHLYFGPRWSPDDRWLGYMDCLPREDPQHFRAALCIGASDGSEHRVVTPGQTHWFGTPYGSNMPEWSPDGTTITYTRLLEGAAQDMSGGGSQVCRLDPFSGAVTELTSGEEGRWDYRAAWSPDGRKLLFTRVRTGAVRELWIMDHDGGNQRPLTRGYESRGADFGRWLKAPT